MATTASMKTTTSLLSVIATKRKRDYHEATSQAVSCVVILLHTKTQRAIWPFNFELLIGTLGRPAARKLGGFLRAGGYPREGLFRNKKTQELCSQLCAAASLVIGLALLDLKCLRDSLSLFMHPSLSLSVSEANFHSKSS